MNIFFVLGVRYEIFHSRMLHWLWSPQGDHGAGDAFWAPVRELLGLGPAGELVIDDEVKIDTTVSGRWRLADLIIRTGDVLILVENKVDPAYQDYLQVQDEIVGGKSIADAEGRRFLFVLIAPGPLTAEMQSLLASRDGLFLSWNDLLAKLAAVPRDKLDSHVSEVVRQYFEFAHRLPTKQGVVNDKVVRESEGAIRQLVAEKTQGSTLTAIELWTEFLKRFPDHVAALDGLYADTKHYSSKTWFAFKLNQWASNRDLIEDTGEWQIASAWGYPKVRVYRRL